VDECGQFPTRGAWRPAAFGHRIPAPADVDADRSIARSRERRAAKSSRPHLPESRLRPAPEPPTMHVEPLEKLPRSVREFLSHYSMIVLSILTALALEQVALRLEHRHEGQRSKEEIELEIATNRKAVEDALAITVQNEKVWDDLLSRTVAEVRSGQPTDASLVDHLREASHNFRDALPPLKTTAWDAAISDHSVNYLAHEDLTRYSEIYASQRLFSQAMWDMLRDSAARDLAAISLGVTLGKADATTTVATLNSRLRTIGIVQSQLMQLDDVLKGSDGAGNGGEPATGASAATSGGSAPQAAAASAAASH
jgi:hypothetical protein